MKTAGKQHHAKMTAHELKMLSSLRDVLNRMETSQDVNSLDEGDEYICTTCDLPIKLCEGHPGAVCVLKATGNTQLSLLHNASGSKKTETHGRCLLCGKRLNSRQLKNNPLRELCPSCEARKVKRSV